MNHIYCDLCHLSVNVPQKQLEFLEEIVKEIKYLHSLNRSRYQLDHLMSKDSNYLISSYNSLIDKIKGSDKDLCYFIKTQNLIKMKEEQLFRHQLPTMINLQACLNDLDLSTINELYCPEHFSSFLIQFESFKSTTNDLKNEIEFLNKLLSCESLIHSILWKDLFQLIKITQVFSTHILEKRLFLFQKIDKLILKHTLDSLRGDFRTSFMANDFNQLFSKNLENRHDNKLNYFKAFQEIKPSVISPKEFSINNTKGVRKEICDILLTSDNESSFYAKSSILNYEGGVGDKGHLFSCRQGYFWINKEKNNVLDLSNNFFLDRNDCIKNFNQLNKIS